MVDAAMFQDLEESLWRAEVRFDPDLYEPMLHPDFLEFGTSGRVWTREASVAMEGAPIPVELPLSAFAVHEVSDDVVLVTYRTIRSTDEGRTASNRSSLWQWVGDRWLLRFHQGTPTTTT
ncbi:nuclear transport factor 2 family protein [Nocardioides sp. KR10-350]|uniref:nuclear transport factor 2 family protein n=1 Tax=Nocardioides cheoyonin TaxID=3156615 RepID=UPI0032B540A1